MGAGMQDMPHHVSSHLSPPIVYRRSTSWGRHYGPRTLPQPPQPCALLRVRAGGGEERSGAACMPGLCHLPFLASLLPPHQPSAA